MAFRIYCRVAAVVFALFTAYPVITKSLDGRLAHDWAHSALHLISMIGAVYGGWLVGSNTFARVYTLSIGVGYVALGVVGWFIDGLLLSTYLAVPLGPVDNAFHLALGVSGVVVAAIGQIRGG